MKTSESLPSYEDEKKSSHQIIIDFTEKQKETIDLGMSPSDVWPIPNLCCADAVLIFYSAPIVKSLFFRGKSGGGGERRRR